MVVLILYFFYYYYSFFHKKFFHDSTKTVGSNNSPFQNKVKDDKVQCPILFGGDRNTQFLAMPIFGHKL